MSVDVKKEVLRLLREDEEFRYTVAGLIGLTEVLKRMDRLEAELVKLREEMVELREDMNKLREDMNAGFERVNRRITALGARWGVDAESTFREAMKGILRDELGLLVERWVVQDAEGSVYGYPSQVEIDVALTDGKTMLVEVSSHVKQADPPIFLRKAQLFEKTTGKKPAKLIFVSPFVDEKAMDACKTLGIQVYTKT
jgi:hypothetical protein